MSKFFDDFKGHIEEDITLYMAARAHHPAPIEEPFLPLFLSHHDHFRRMRQLRDEVVLKIDEILSNLLWVQNFWTTFRKA